MTPVADERTATRQVVEAGCLPVPPDDSPSAGPATSRVRTGDTIVVTPTGVSLGALEPDGLSVIDLAGRHVGGADPTKEAFLHAAVYRARPDAGASRPPAQPRMRSPSPASPTPTPRTSFHRSPPTTSCGSARCRSCPTTPLVTTAWRRSAEETAREHPCFLLANHGPVVAATDLAAAADAAEELEETARLHLLLHGHATRPLTDDQVDVTEPEVPAMTVAAPTRLKAFGAEVLVSLGVPDVDAELVTDSLVTADLWGHPSHGMLRLPWYAARLRSGVMTAATTATVVTDLGAVAVLDGGDGVGQVVTDRACSQAVSRAAQHGVGVVAVRNSNHFGTAAYWTRRMAEAGCVAILTTNGSPAMAPWGGTKKTVGANPWSVATPGGKHPPVVLDIANTGVARGKIYAAAQRGESIPDTWALDEDGAPTTDPHVAVHGLLAPMGGHKGYGISFMMDVLSGVLTGSGFATEVAGPYVPDRRSRCGHLVVALRVDAFCPATTSMPASTT